MHAYAPAAALSSSTVVSHAKTERGAMRITSSNSNKSNASTSAAHYVAFDVVLVIASVATTLLAVSIILLLLFARLIRRIAAAHQLQQQQQYDARYRWTQDELADDAAAVAASPRSEGAIAIREAESDRGAADEGAVNAIDADQQPLLRPQLRSSTAAAAAAPSPPGLFDALRIVIGMSAIDSSRGPSDAYGDRVDARFENGRRTRWQAEYPPVWYGPGVESSRIDHAHLLRNVNDTSSGAPHLYPGSSHRALRSSPMHASSPTLVNREVGERGSVVALRHPEVQDGVSTAFAASPHEHQQQQQQQQQQLLSARDDPRAAEVKQTPAASPNIATDGEEAVPFHATSQKDLVVFHTTHDSRYRLLQRIGMGAFSSVYLVQHKTTGQKYALKYILCKDDRERLTALRECEVIHCLQGHPQVIRIVDMFMNYQFQRATTRVEKANETTGTTTAAAAASSMGNRPSNTGNPRFSPQSLRPLQPWQVSTSLVNAPPQIQPRAPPAASSSPSLWARPSAAPTSPLLLHESRPPPSPAPGDAQQPFRLSASTRSSSNVRAAAAAAPAILPRSVGSPASPSSPISVTNAQAATATATATTTTTKWVGVQLQGLKDEVMKKVGSSTQLADDEVIAALRARVRKPGCPIAANFAENADEHDRRGRSSDEEMHGADVDSTDDNHDDSTDRDTLEVESEHAPLILSAADTERLLMDARLLQQRRRRQRAQTRRRREHHKKDATAATATGGIISSAHPSSSFHHGFGDKSSTSLSSLHHQQQQQPPQAVSRSSSNASRRLLRPYDVSPTGVSHYSNTAAAAAAAAAVASTAASGGGGGVSPVHTSASSNTRGSRFPTPPAPPHAPLQRPTINTAANYSSPAATTSASGGYAGVVSYGRNFPISPHVRGAAENADSGSSSISRCGAGTPKMLPGVRRGSSDGTWKGDAAPGAAGMDMGQSSACVSNGATTTTTAAMNAAQTRTTYSSTNRSHTSSPSVSQEHYGTHAVDDEDGAAEIARDSSSRNSNSSNSSSSSSGSVEEPLQPIRRVLVPPPLYMHPPPGCYAPSNFPVKEAEQRAAAAAGGSGEDENEDDHSDSDTKTEEEEKRTTVKRPSGFTRAALSNNASPPASPTSYVSKNRYANFTMNIAGVVSNGHLTPPPPPSSSKAPPASAQEGQDEKAGVQEDMQRSTSPVPKASPPPPLMDLENAADAASAMEEDVDAPSPAAAAAVAATQTLSLQQQQQQQLQRTSYAPKQQQQPLQQRQQPAQKAAASSYAPAAALMGTAIAPKPAAAASYAPKRGTGGTSATSLSELLRADVTESSPSSTAKTSSDFPDSPLAPDAAPRASTKGVNKDTTAETALTDAPMPVGTASMNVIVLNNTATTAAAPTSPAMNGNNHNHTSSSGSNSYAPVREGKASSYVNPYLERARGGEVVPPPRTSYAPGGGVRYNGLMASPTSAVPATTNTALNPAVSSSYLSQQRQQQQQQQRRGPVMREWNDGPSALLSNSESPVNTTTAAPSANSFTSPPIDLSPTPSQQQQQQQQQEQQLAGMAQCATTRNTYAPLRYGNLIQPVATVTPPTPDDLRRSITTATTTAVAAAVQPAQHLVSLPTTTTTTTTITTGTSASQASTLHSHTKGTSGRLSVSAAIRSARAGQQGERMHLNDGKPHVHVPTPKPDGHLEPARPYMNPNELNRTHVVRGDRSDGSSSSSSEGSETDGHTFALRKEPKRASDAQTGVMAVYGEAPSPQRPLYTNLGVTLTEVEPQQLTQQRPSAGATAAASMGGSSHLYANTATAAGSGASATSHLFRTPPTAAGVVPSYGATAQSNVRATYGPVRSYAPAVRYANVGNPGLWNTYGQPSAAIGPASVAAARATAQGLKNSFTGMANGSLTPGNGSTNGNGEQTNTHKEGNPNNKNNKNDDDDNSSAAGTASTTQSNSSGSLSQDVRDTGYLCLVMEYQPMGDLCHYVLRAKQQLALQEQQQQQQMMMMMRASMSCSVLDGRPGATPTTPSPSDHSSVLYGGNPPQTANNNNSNVIAASSLTGHWATDPNSPTNFMGSSTASWVAAAAAATWRVQPATSRADLNLAMTTAAAATDVAGGEGSQQQQNSTSKNREGATGAKEDPTSRNALTEPQLLSIAYQLASVLDHMHHQSPPIIHRDLKPENILIKGELTDFLEDIPAEVMKAELGGAMPHVSKPASPLTPANATTTAAAAGAAAAASVGRINYPERSSLTPQTPFLASPGSNASPAASATAGLPSQPPPIRITRAVVPIVVTDFGLAMVQELHGRSHHGRGGGTRPYIAPECWQGATCTASDVWSLGCVLYALATTRLTARTVRLMSEEAKRDGFASRMLNDILHHKYSLAFASFVVSLLVVDPAKRPSAAQAAQCFVVTEHEVRFDPSSPFFSNVLDL